MTVPLYTNLLRQQLQILQWQHFYHHHHPLQVSNHCFYQVQILQWLHFHYQHHPLQVMDHHFHPCKLSLTILNLSIAILLLNTNHTSSQLGYCLNTFHIIITITAVLTISIGQDAIVCCWWTSAINIPFFYRITISRWAKETFSKYQKVQKIGCDHNLRMNVITYHSILLQTKRYKTVIFSDLIILYQLKMCGISTLNLFTYFYSSIDSFLPLNFALLSFNFNYHYGWKVRSSFLKFSNKHFYEHGSDHLYEI